MEVRESINDSVDAELDRLISRRASQDTRPDPAEKEELWKRSVRVHHARIREEHRQAWCDYHRLLAGQHRAVLEALIAHHEAMAERLQTTDERK